MENHTTGEPVLPKLISKRSTDQWTLRKARAYLMQVAFAALEGATSNDPRVTALALALVRKSAWLPTKKS